MYLLFDLGGTKSRFAISSDRTSFDDPIIIDTPKNFSEAILEYSTVIKKLLIGKELKGCVGCVAGVMSKDNKKLIKSSPKLPDWEGKLLSYELERIIKISPHIYNDADMACLGEAVFGAGKEGSIIAYITVSSGIGGGLVIDKKLQKSTYGFEPGYQIINPKTKENIQDLIGGDSWEKRLGIPAKEIVDPKVYEEITDYLGIALTNLIYFWSPDTIVMGGGITNDLDMEEISDSIEKNMHQFPEVPVIKRAELGSLNGLYGSLVQSREL